MTFKPSLPFWPGRLLMLALTAGLYSCSRPVRPAASTQAAPPPASRAAPAPAAEPTGPIPGVAPSVQSSAPEPAAAPAKDVEETLPSGLIIAQKQVGGPPPGPELPKGTRILHIGDSFAGALGIELGRLLKSRGLESRLSFKQSTYIPTWAYSQELPQLLARFKPDLVLISLGANELENPEPEKRAPLIHRLVERLGGRPCVWVAPVLWEGAKSSLLDVIQENAAPCRYLDSNQLIKHMPRAGDQIHPSMAARPDWAEVILRWLAYHRRPTAEQIWAISSDPGGQPAF